MNDNQRNFQEAKPSRGTSLDKVRRAQEDKREKDSNKPKEVVAIDCEMVKHGAEKKKSQLARVSIVNMNGDCVYDKYVQPQKEVTDYRYEFSGITPELLMNAEPFKEVRKEVRDLIKGRIVVGHSLKNDFGAGGLKTDIRPGLKRDTSLYFKHPNCLVCQKYREAMNSKPPSKQN